MKRTSPLFSIIIPSLNEEEALPLLLKDLTEQTLKSFEVILVDGNSGDSTIKKAKKFSQKLPQLTILTSNKRHVSVQRNLGAKKANGRYLIFSDADNRLPEFFLEGIKYRLRRTPVQVFTSWCQADTNKPADKAIATLINITLETANKLDYPGALGAMIGCTPKAFKKVKGFDPEIAFAEDREFIRQACEKNISFHIFKDPRFICSLRRFRKEGKLRALQQYAKLHLKSITQQHINRNEYPMGGHAFKDDSPTDSLINKLQSSLTTSKKKPKIKQKLQSLVSLLENDHD
jgi:glycosyltransferase involved in cell wall biosynthesis